MFEFANPAWLFLLVAVPVLTWWWLRRERSALRYPDTGWVAELPRGRGRWIRWISAGARAVALALIVIALAGPRWPDLRTRIPTEGIAISMLVDVSGSMAEPDFDWQGEPITRLDAVKKVFRLFVEGGVGPDGEKLEGRATDQIALVTFATRPDRPYPLTLSHSVLLRLLDDEKPRSITGEMETNISDAVAEGLERLQSAGPKRRKVMILLSDGEHNVTPTQSGWTPRQAAQVAASLGVPVYTIDAGGEGGSGLEGNVDSAATREAGRKTLRDIAEVTHGRSFQAKDTRELLSVCQEIDRLERQEIQSFQYRRYYEAYPWFGLASFALFVLIQVLELTIWQRVP
jgi:Ca-activated chloride channel family protein